MLINEYDVEEREFLKCVTKFPVVDVQTNDTVISSHVIYKFKVHEGKSLMLRDFNAPHRNYDCQKSDLCTEFCICSWCVVRIILSIEYIRRWSMSKPDVKSVFLKTGRSQRDVYLVSLREITGRDHYWLLLTAEYGLVNYNAKWQYQSDYILQDLGLKQIPVVVQMLYEIDYDDILLFVAKVVDEIITTGL